MIRQTIYKSKKSFSMMMAIFLLILISSMSIMIFNLSNQAIKSTLNQYQNEQARLLLYNYTELAVLYLLHYNRVDKNNCLQEIETQFNKNELLFNVKIKIYYIGFKESLPNCSNILQSFTNNTNFDRTMSVLLDIYIKYKDIDNKDNRVFSMHKRSIQKL